MVAVEFTVSYNGKTSREVEGHNAMSASGSNSYHTGLQALSQHIVHDAMYDSSAHSSPPSVTLNEVLEQVVTWIDDPNPMFPVLWLKGSNVSGKSSLAKSLTEICRASRRLGGSFIFRKETDGRDEGIYLFSTIAYQLALNVPGLLEPIDNAMSRDPLLATKPVEVQFQSLIVKPFQNSFSPRRNSVIIIDCLEECRGPETQQLILKLIAHAITIFKLPLQFLITSSPEDNIRQVFETEILSNITRAMDLDTSVEATRVEPSLQSSYDIRLLFQHRGSRSTKKPPFDTLSFPRIVTKRQGNGGAETYSHALLLHGHGFPIWHPPGDIGKPVEYLQKGVRIGDVGVIDKDGIFDFRFNIFLAPDDPVHARLAPREFKPINPPLHHSEVKYDPGYFKAGDVVASKGIEVTRHSESPLDISFTSLEEEGAILVLPDGASREDLISTGRFHEYAKRNAPHWYQVINGYGGVVHTNGSLFLVTGCDKATDWANASFPYHPGNSETLVDLRYTWQPDYEPPWDGGTAVTKFYAPPSFKKVPDIGDRKNQCVFVRGMRISLSETSWGKTLPQLWSARLYYSCILHTPSKIRLWFDSVLVFLHLRLSERRAVKKVTSARLQLFHPNYFIGQVLLAEHPDAEVALVDDTVWRSLTHGESCTLLEMNEVVTKVFELYTIVQHDGIITLVPKPHEGLKNVANDSPTSFHEFGRKLLSFIPNLQPKNSERRHPTQWVKDVSISTHAKLF